MTRRILTIDEKYWKGKPLWLNGEPCELVSVDFTTMCVGVLYHDQFLNQIREIELGFTRFETTDEPVDIRVTSYGGAKAKANFDEPAVKGQYD